MSGQTQFESAIPRSMVEEGIYYLSRCGIAAEPDLARSSEVMESMLGTILERSGYGLAEGVLEKMGERAVEYFDRHFDFENPDEDTSSPRFVEGLLNYTLLETVAE